MFKYIIDAMDTNEWTALLPLVLFVIIFTVIIIMVMRQKKSYTDKMSNMPFEDDTIEIDSKKTI